VRARTAVSAVGCVAVEVGGAGGLAADDVAGGVGDGDYGERRVGEMRERMRKAGEESRKRGKKGKDARTAGQSELMSAEQDGALQSPELVTIKRNR
jgi:hypothetical protein